MDSSATGQGLVTGSFENINELVDSIKGEEYFV
jgi:hypothetical protein